MNIDHDEVQFFERIVLVLIHLLWIKVFIYFLLLLNILPFLPGLLVLPPSKIGEPPNS